MTRSPPTVVKTLLALAVAGSMAAFFVQPAAAQTATNLNCSGCIKSKQIKNGKVKGKDLKNSTVTGSKIAPDAVDGSKIADGAVGSSEVAGESLLAADLQNEAGADGVANLDSEALSGVDDLVQTLIITAPGPGVVVVNASGYFSGAAGANKRVNCSLTTGTALLSGNDRLRHDFEEAQSSYAMTKLFNVSAGTNTFNLVCREFVGEVNIIGRQMTAMYFPTVY